MGGWEIHLFELMAPFILPGEEIVDAIYQPGNTFFSLVRPTPVVNPRPTMDDAEEMVGEGMVLEEEDDEYPPSPVGELGDGRGLSVDHWIDWGMKLYVLLLRHVLDRPNGGQEVAKASKRRDDKYRRRAVE